MGRWLRQSTETTINLGPFVKIADGSLEEAATEANIDVVLLKHSNTASGTHTHITPDSGGNTMTYADHGMYNLLLLQGNVDTLGRLDIVCTYSGCYPVIDSFMVVPGCTWDSEIAGDKAALSDFFSFQTSDGSFSTAGGIGQFLLTLLSDETIPEVSGPLDESSTITQLLGWLKGITHNQVTQSNDTKTIFNSAGSAVAVMTTSDNGTLYTQTKAASPE